MKKAVGSITLFSGMIFMLLVSVVSATIVSARVNAAKVYVGCTASMALDSVFSEYNPELFSEYGILSFDGRMGGMMVDEDAIAAKIAHYMSYNLNGATLKGVDVTGLYRVTDEGGVLWYDMVVDYEKYAKVIDLAADFLQINSQSEEAKAVNEINDEITECTSAIVSINRQARLLVEVIDGVECPKKGIDVNNLKPMDNFVKKMSLKVLPPASELKINCQPVADMVRVNVVDPLSLLCQSKECYEMGNIPKARGYFREFRTIIDNEFDALNAAYDVAIETVISANTLKSNLRQAKEHIAGYADIIDSEVFGELSKEVDKLEAYDEVMAEEICDVYKIFESIYRNRSLVNDIQDLSRQMNFDSDDRLTRICFDRIFTLLYDFDISELVINYEHLMKSDDDNTDILDKIMDFMEDGVLSIVLPKDVDASKRSMGKPPVRASSVCNYKNAPDMGLAKKIIYSEYVFDHFNTFLDGENGAVLDYEVEYILFGNQKDSTNLLETVLAIATLRSGVNMLYLLTDSEKKESAYALAAMLVGASGIEPLIRLTQYTLMYEWAYAEALSDVRILLDGGKLGVKKTKDTWKLTLENLLSCNFTADKNDGVRNGFDYEDFLRLFLYMESDGKKAAYTMDLVEMSMVSKGHKSFRFFTQVYAVEIACNYVVPGWDKEYSQRAVYAY